MLFPTRCLELSRRAYQRNGKLRRRTRSGAHHAVELHSKYIVQSVFDKRVAEAMAKGVEGAAYATRVARRDRAGAGT